MPEHQHHRCDVIVVGGGMVGISLGVALARGGMRVALVEKAASPAPMVLVGELTKARAWVSR